MGILRIVVVVGGRLGGGWVVVELLLSEVREGRMTEVVGVVIIADSFGYKVVELVGMMVLDMK